jgi:hypothetical protein
VISLIYGSNKPGVPDSLFFQIVNNLE